MFTIRRNKYGKLMYATGVANNHITHLATDPTSAVQLDEPTARAVVDAHKARNNPAAGRIEAVDAKGKVIAAAGDPGEPPAPPKPVASLPGLAERVEKLEERVDMIEAADKTGGVNESAIDAALAKAVKGMPLLLKSDVPPPSFTADEVSALKGMLGEWAAHKSREAAKEAIDPKTSKAPAGTGGGQKSPTAPVVPAG